MADLFGSPQMAAGYANSRPPVHAHIVTRIRERLGIVEPVNQALDVGCGSGLSTRPLQPVARHCLGIEPAATMLPWARKTAPGAVFVAGRAEELPVRSGSVDIITAAGSLNYADLGRFFPEALRVLVPGGVLVIYDFSQGRTFRHSTALDAWFENFLRRYPNPVDSGRAISPESLAVRTDALRLAGHEFFEIGLVLSQDSYLNYLMTETNVAEAVREGASLAGVRNWCATTLLPVFAGRDAEVMFRGYIAYLS